MVQDGSHKKTEDPKDQKIKVIQKKVVKSTPQPGQPEFFIEVTDTKVGGNPVFNVYEGQAPSKENYRASVSFQNGSLIEYSTSKEIQLPMNALSQIIRAHKEYISEHPVVPEAPKAPAVKQSTQPTKTIDDMIKEMNLDGDEATQPSVERIGASQPPKPTQPPKTGVATPTAQPSPTKIKDFIAQTQKPKTNVPEAPVAPTAPTYVAPPTVPETKVPKAPEAPVAPTAPTYVVKPETKAPPKVPEAPVAPTAPAVKPITPTPTIPAPKPTEAPVAPTAPEVKPTKAPEALQVKDDGPILDLTPVPPAEEPKLVETPKDTEVKLDSKQLVQMKDNIVYLHSSAFEVTCVGNYWLFKKDNKFYRLADMSGTPREIKTDDAGEAACHLYENIQEIVNNYAKMIDQEEKSLTELADDLAEAQKRTETLKSLEERIGSEVQAKESAQSALRALELEKKKLGTDIKTHETTIAQLNEQKVDASKYEEQLTALKKQNEQYESAITNLKAIANDASTAATAWEGQYKSILKEKESLGQAAQAMKEAMLKANSNARETVANYQVLKQKCSELLQQNTDLQAKLESKQ